MLVFDKFRGGRELVPGRELVHHHYILKDTRRHYVALFIKYVSNLIYVKIQSLKLHSNDINNSKRLLSKKGLYFRPQ